MIYREATLADLDVLRSTELKVVEAERPFNSSIKAGSPHYYDISKLISDENTYLLVAQDQNSIIGTGYAQIRTSKESLEHRIHSYFGFMYVANEYRGKGINARIIEQLIKWSLDQGAKDCYLDVYSDNTAAVRAYQKAGFEASVTEMKLKI